MGKDVSKPVIDFLNGEDVPTNFDHANVILIPKVANLSNSGNFCPISLCNVVYKLPTKIITNRL